ncbi:MAG TPA: hypothetical protein VN655_04835 [Pseudolabrys sp.]|jgi:hypothetical protein|nr:hypothetical protein [Pseudolabrys sp.]
MTNDRRPEFRLYTRNDLFRSGAVAAGWAVFYILLVAYAAFWPGQGPRLASDTAGASTVAESGIASHSATLRPHHDRPAR